MYVHNPKTWASHYPCFLRVAPAAKHFAPQGRGLLNENRSGCQQAAVKHHRYCVVLSNAVAFRTDSAGTASARSGEYKKASIPRGGSCPHTAAGRAWALTALVCCTRFFNESIEVKYQWLSVSASRPTSIKNYTWMRSTCRHHLSPNILGSEGQQRLLPRQGHQDAGIQDSRPSCPVGVTLI